MSEYALKTGLPSSLDSEQLVLGSILLDDSLFVQIAGTLEVNDFMVESHRRIFARMLELHERGEKIDRITVFNELLKHNQAESCGGLTYLSSLDNDLPRLPNLDGYVAIVRDKSLLRRIIFASQKLIDRCLIGGEEPAEILAGAEDSLLKLSDYRDQEGLSSPEEIIRNYPGGLNAFLDPSKRVKGLATGFVKLDEMTGGFHPGELIILAARPAMGKTALALNIAQHAVTAKTKQTVAVFSLEMSKESLVTRMLCAAARVDSQKFRAGYLSHAERIRLQTAAAQLSGAPLHIDDTAGLNILDLHAKLRRLKAEQGLHLVILDYLQLMSSRGPSENRNQEISALSRGLKLLSKELGTPILALSQLNRAPEVRQGDHRPQLSDLRESGSLEQDADVVAFIFREEVYKPEREDLRGSAELLLSKQRNGPTGKINLVFLRQWTKFENRASDLGEESGAGAFTGFDPEGET